MVTRPSDHPHGTPGRSSDSVRSRSRFRSRSPCRDGAHCAQGVHVGLGQHGRKSDVELGVEIGCGQPTGWFIIPASGWFGWVSLRICQAGVPTFRQPPAVTDTGLRQPTLADRPGRSDPAGTLDGVFPDCHIRLVNWSGHQDRSTGIDRNRQGWAFPNPTTCMTHRRPLRSPALVGPDLSPPAGRSESADPLADPARLHHAPTSHRAQCPNHCHP